MGTVWRLIRDVDRDAAMNMAVDEAIMLSHTAGECPPTLRFYGWIRPSISLGYFQDISRGGFDVDSCARHGVQLVRRLTGGRAVLHGHDLTFSITAAESELPSDNRSVLGSHSWLMGGIVEGLRLLGIDAQLGGPGGGPHSERSADCFAHAAACDIVVGRFKVAGSAQVRRNGVILEQGSIPFRRPDIEPSAVFGRQSQVSHVFREDPDRVTLEDAIIAGFQRALGIGLTEGQLSDGELACARDLVESRFGTVEWTHRRPGAFVDIRK